MTKEDPPDNKSGRRVNETIRLFDARVLGQSLHEVAVDVIRNEEHDIESRWFHSSQDIDLYIWRDARKNIVKQQVGFFGQIAEWNIVEGVRTGFVIEEEASPGIAGTPLVQFDVEPNRTTLEQGIEIIGFTAGLKFVEKQQLIDNFLRSPHLANLTPEEVWRRFGHTEGVENDGAAGQIRRLGQVIAARLRKWLKLG